MDRRKLIPNLAFRKQILSGSQISPPKSVSSSQASKEMKRSVSENITCKRKHSEDEKEQSQFNSTKFMKTNIIADSDDEDDMSKDDDSCDFEGSQDSNDNIFTKSKPTAGTYEKSVFTNEHAEESGSKESYIMGVLNSLRKSPLEFNQCQSLDSSGDKVRKFNLKASGSFNSKKTLSQIMAKRNNERTKGNKKREILSADQPAKKVHLDSKNNLPLNDSLEASLISSGLSNILDETSFSDPDTEASIKLENNKNEDNEPTSTFRSSKTESPCKTLETNRVSNSPEVCPLKLQETNRRDTNSPVNYPNNSSTNNKFIDFVTKAGINLATGEDLHTSSDHPQKAIKKMRNLLNSDNLSVNDILHHWNTYINDEENFKKFIEEIKIETDEGVVISSKATTLCKILLQIPQLQIAIIDTIIKKLTDKIIATDSADDAPLAIQMLQQFRFLELIDNPDHLITKLENLLTASPEWFQRNVILFIPDIIIDSQHQAITEILIKIMENNSDLTNTILECICNLVLEKNYKEELREKIIKLLNEKFEKRVVPAVTKFILSVCPTETTALKSLNALRSVDMTPSSKEEQDECYTDQMFVINTIKMNFELCKEVNQAALSLIKHRYSETVPLDIIILILLYDTLPTKRKNIETTLCTHIKNGYYDSFILKNFYTGYTEVAKSLQTSALNLALNLLKTDSSTQVEFGIKWVRSIFTSQHDTPHKQREVLEKLLNIMGNKNKSVKNALKVLEKITFDEVERQYLQRHTGFIRIFIEKINELNFDEVAIMYHILHGLCTQSETIANVLNDDLNIIMQKQLCSSKVLTKCKGVIGAVMSIKHLAIRTETSDQAFKLLVNTRKSLKGCTKSQALFYDELSKIISTTKNIDEAFLGKTKDFLEEKFENSCFVENNLNNELEPKFGLNNLDAVSVQYINFGSSNISTFTFALLKLLCACYTKLSGDFSNIDAVLGCAVLLPVNLETPLPLNAEYMIHCINWFRELISSFISYNDNMLREQLSKRVESLMNLQAEFASMVSMLESRYEPPPCYFHYFPMPKFQRIEFKTGRKRKSRKNKDKALKVNNNTDKEENLIDVTLNKSLTLLPDWENWETGSELTFKNPAYFRQMDPKIAHLLESNLDIKTTQPTHETITIPQVCFIIKELLFMMEHQASEILISDLVEILPKITGKLQQIIEDLKKCENIYKRETVKLFLHLLTKLFSWKEFQNPRHFSLLRDGLRTLAGMMNEESAVLRNCTELVAEAYNYFETIGDIATQISLAVALVNVCKCLMKISKTFAKSSKGRLATMAHGYLSLEWNDDIQGSLYRSAIKELLHIWIDNEPDPLKTVASTLDWLPEQAAILTRSNSRLNTLQSITKCNLYLLLKQLFTGLVKGIEVSLNKDESDPERIRTWKIVASCLEKITNIVRLNNKNTNYLALYLRNTAILYQNLLINGMKLLEVNIKYQSRDVLEVIKLFQSAGKFLRDIFCTARKEKNLPLLTLMPLMNSRREKFIYMVKGILAANNSVDTFVMANILKKDLDGEEINSEASQATQEEDLDIVNNYEITSEPEIFNSESEENDDEDP